MFFTFVGQNAHKKLRIQRLLRCVCQLLCVPSLLVLLWNGEDITKKSDEFPWDLGSSWGNWHGKNCELTPRTPWIQIGRVLRFSQIDYHEILWFHQLRQAFSVAMLHYQRGLISLIHKNRYTGIKACQYLGLHIELASVAGCPKWGSIPKWRFIGFGGL